VNFEVPEYENCSPNYFRLDSKMHSSTILWTVKNVSICILEPSVLTYCPSEANDYVTTFTRIHNFYVTVVLSSNLACANPTSIILSPLPVYSSTWKNSNCHCGTRTGLYKVHPESKNWSSMPATQVVWRLLYAKGNISPLFWKKELTECSSKW